MSTCNKESALRRLELPSEFEDAAAYWQHLFPYAVRANRRDPVVLRRGHPPSFRLFIRLTGEGCRHQATGPFC